MRILNRGEAYSIDPKFVLSQSKRSKYYVFTGTGWLTFSNTKQLNVYVEMKLRQNKLK